MMPAKIEFKVGLFVIVTTLLIIGSIGYVAYKKGIFEEVRTFTLSSKSGEELTEGMPVVFSGFKIGVVHSLELSENGSVLIKIRVPERHVKWVRSNSRFIVNKPFIGSSRIVVLTDDLSSPVLSKEKVPDVATANDINEAIKKLQPMFEEVNKVVANVEKVTANLADPQGDVRKILRNSEQVTAGIDSILKDDVREILKNSEQVTARVDSILTKVDTMAAKTDETMYGKEGLLPLVRKILEDLLVKLGKIDVALDNVVKISADTADSTKDLKLLRSEIDTTVNSINDLVKEINRKIPFKEKPEIKLP
jgi:phospholipid/cholesterol/gamma-HCH transport system substrate-binding protein